MNTKDISIDKVTIYSDIVEAFRENKKLCKDLYKNSKKRSIRTMINSNNEFGKHLENTILINGIRELTMTKEISYQRKEYKYEGMKVCLEFPEPTENDNIIEKEIKDILTYVLKEQMRKIS